MTGRRIFQFAHARLCTPLAQVFMLSVQLFCMVYVAAFSANNYLNRLRNGNRRYLCCSDCSKLKLERCSNHKNFFFPVVPKLLSLLLSQPFSLLHQQHVSFRQPKRVSSNHRKSVHRE
nr:MAG TPA: hypothetical protein [Caudoviricetes sp.]